jgi:hypothetical protein
MAKVTGANEREIQIAAYLTPAALAEANGKLGRWMVVDTPIGEPYPCQCGGRCGPKCPCRGRLDLDGVPTTCCGLRGRAAEERQVTAGCIGCGTPVPLKRWEIESGSRLVRCEACALAVTEAQILAREGEDRGLYRRVSPFDPNRRDPKYGGKTELADFLAQIDDRWLPVDQRPVRCTVCLGVVDPIARTAEHPGTHPTCDPNWMTYPEGRPMETPLEVVPSESAEDFSAPENEVPAVEPPARKEVVIEKSEGKRDPYASFLARKTQWDDASGFEPLWMPDFLYPFQAHLVDWAIRMGRGALFTDCGTGKTPMQLVWAENVRRKTGKPVLIVCPLAVSYQTVAEATKFGVEAAVSRDGKVTAGITITNYERLEKFDTNDFGGVVCDESSAIKAFAGVRRAIVTEFLRTHRYRLLGTATAAPNDYTELGTSSEALGYLGLMDMLGKFFINKQKTADVKGRWRATDRLTTGGAVLHEREAIGWRFKGHAEEGFWRWVASWARAMRTPSDLGFDDNGFILPALDHRQHVVQPAPVPEELMTTLFEVPAYGLKEEKEELRRTLAERCEMAAKVLVDADHAVAWCHLNDEGRRLTKEIDGAVEVTGSMPTDQKEEILHAFGDGEIRVLVTKPSIAGWGLNWQHANRMTFFPSHSYEQYYQAVRRMWRFGQPRPVTVDVITTPGGAHALANLQRKADAADRMFDQLVTYMRDAAGVRRTDVYETEIEVPSWL